MHFIRLTKYLTHIKIFYSLYATKQQYSQYLYAGGIRIESRLAYRILFSWFYSGSGSKFWDSTLTNITISFPVFI
jgi:hypothetical protein